MWVKGSEYMGVNWELLQFLELYHDSTKIGRARILSESQIKSVSY